MTNVLPTTLQIGDYVPLIKINCIRGWKELYNYCNDKPFLFITIKNMNLEKIRTHCVDFSLFNVVILFKDGHLEQELKYVVFSRDEQLAKMLRVDDESTFYFANPNRKIVSIMTHTELVNSSIFDISQLLQKNKNVPFLLIENVLDETLLNKTIAFFNKKKEEGKLIVHQSNTKDRQHVYPDVELEKELDHKLSRSLLPEVKKNFYFDVQYRELYKICCYDFDSSGRFHAHRDTPLPFQHRKYALSLFLNDDYEGGDFVLLEYGVKVKPKANTAIVFPGINTHQVLPVTKGSRMTLVSFFVDGTHKPQYKMKAHFFKDANIIESDIYPI